MSFFFLESSIAGILHLADGVFLRACVPSPAHLARVQSQAHQRLLKIFNILLSEDDFWAIFKFIFLTFSTTVNACNEWQVPKTAYSINQNYFP